MRVLVIDDDLSIATYLGNVVASIGLEPVVCTDSINAVAAHLVDLRVVAVLTDFAMPGLNGVEVLSAFQERRPAVRRLMTTAFNDREEVREAVASGVIEWLFPKPPSISMLRLSLAWFNRGGGGSSFRP